MTSDSEITRKDMVVTLRSMANMLAYPEETDGSRYIVRVILAAADELGEQHKEG